MHAGSEAGAGSSPIELTTPIAVEAILPKVIDCCGCYVASVFQRSRVVLTSAHPRCSWSALFPGAAVHSGNRWPLAGQGSNQNKPLGVQIVGAGNDGCCRVKRRQQALSRRANGRLFSAAAAKSFSIATHCRRAQWWLVGERAERTFLVDASTTIAMNENRAPPGYRNAGGQQARWSPPASRNLARLALDRR